MFIVLIIGDYLLNLQWQKYRLFFDKKYLSVMPQSTMKQKTPFNQGVFSIIWRSELMFLNQTIPHRTNGCLGTVINLEFLKNNREVIFDSPFR